jgi:diacylglycerol kinase (ATP)
LRQSNLFSAALASFAGLASAWRSERSFRQEAALFVAALPLSFVVTPEVFRRAELIASLLAVLAVELLNTAIEKFCDHVTPETNPRIKIIKDMGSAAVFCALCMAAALWGAAALARFG